MNKDNKILCDFCLLDTCTYTVINILINEGYLNLCSACYYTYHQDKRETYKQVMNIFNNKN